MIYRARFVLTMNGNVINDGFVAVRGGKIDDVGEFRNIKKARDEQIVDCRPLILIPGLINCHTHLEEGMLRSQLDVPQNFTSWYTRTNKYFSQADLIKRFNAVRLGCRESLFSGTTTIADTASTGSSFLVLREEQIHSIIFLSLKGLIPWQSASMFKEVKHHLKLLNYIFPEYRTGLSPQSPYSTSIELYRLSIKRIKKNNMRFQTHLAESSEELEMFSSHSGPLFEYSQRQHPMDLHSYTKGSTSFMFKNNLLPSNSLIIHGNYLSSEELEALARRNVSLVHCAQSHDFFGHKSFPFETALARGVNVCLGTESLASASTLSLFDDMNIIKRRHPQLDAKDILNFATVNGAKALGLEGKTGVLAPGYEADIVGIRLACDNKDELYDELVLGDPQIEFVMVGGEEVIS